MTLKILSGKHKCSSHVAENCCNKSEQAACWRSDRETEILNFYLIIWKEWKNLCDVTSFIFLFSYVRHTDLLYLSLKLQVGFTLNKLYMQVFNKRRGKMAPLINVANPCVSAIKTVCAAYSDTRNCIYRTVFFLTLDCQLYLEQLWVMDKPVDCFCFPFVRWCQLLFQSTHVMLLLEPANQNLLS